MALTSTNEAVASRLQLNGQQYCFVKVQDQSKFAFVDPNPEIICGNYDHQEERVAIGPRLIRLNVLMMPTPEEYDLLLPLIGFTETTNVFAPKNNLTVFNAQVDYSTVDVGNYLQGVVDKAIFRGQQGLSPLSLELQMVFQDYNLSSAFSATALTTANAPYEFTSGVLSLGETGATTRRFNSFVCVYDNQVRSRFNNATTADNLPNTQRIVHLGVNTPYTASEDDLLIDATTDSTRLAGQQASVAFTRSPQSMTFDFGNLKWEAKAPDIVKSAETRLMQFYKALRVGTDPVMTITNILSA